ncbi:hypothetical protein LTR41_005439 [Exophiala xenobiotica]|nr:hypothetical protein LTR41_005439 [Exophiala xenobiotica]
MFAMGLVTLHAAATCVAAFPGPSKSEHAHSLLERSTCTPRPKGLWQPVVGVSWNYQLGQPVTTPANIPSTPKVWDIDLFDNNAANIKAMRNKGHKVICYFSAGSYEDWRPDASNFNASDLGNDLDGWPGEKWLDIGSKNVRNIMKSRLDLAVKKGCDGVDPDNVDGYDNDNGLGLTDEDSINYMIFLANQAHSRNLSIGLKNAGGIIDGVIDCMEWSVNEQCVAYDECDTYAAFIQHDKPVFHVEYPKGTDKSNKNPVSSKTQKKFCENSEEGRFSTILKNINLDDWIVTC